MRVLALFALLLPACNECSFWERCDGDTLLVCGSGVDQQVGRKIERYDCATPNATCREVDEHAFCVADGGLACDPATFVPSCEGDLLRSCPADVGYELVTDCLDTYGGTCADAGSGAACTSG